MVVKSSTARTIVRLLKEAMDNFIKDGCMAMGAALSFYSAFSLAPLILIAVAIAGTFFGEEAVRGSLEAGLRSELGPANAAIIQDMLAHSRRPETNLFMSVIGVVLLLVGAGGVFGQLQAALNTIWDAGTPPAGGVNRILKNHLMSFSMVLVTGFLLLVSMLLSTALHALAEHFGGPGNLPLAGWLTGGVMSFAVTAVLFAAIFKILPDRNILWRDVGAGAVFTSAFFMIGKVVIAWYLGRKASASSYGSAGSFVMLLSWLHYSSIILLYGAEVTATHARYRRDETGSSAENDSSLEQ